MLGPFQWAGIGFMRYDESMNIQKTSMGVELVTDSGAVLIRQVFGIGRNYAAHAAEQGLEAPAHPMVFTKNPMSVCGDGDEIVIPPIARGEEFGGNQTDFEAELAVIIGEGPDGRLCKDVSREDAMGMCLGSPVRMMCRRGGGKRRVRGVSFVGGRDLILFVRWGRGL